MLKYIITGVDDSGNIEQDDSDSENIRRAGVVQFLVKKKASLKKKSKALSKIKAINCIWETVPSPR